MVPCSFLFAVAVILVRIGGVGTSSPEGGLEGPCPSSIDKFVMNDSCLTFLS